MLALRIFTNINVLWLFASSVYAVVFVVERSTKQRQTGGWWQQNEVTIVVSLITNVFPFIFEMLGSLEQYHPRKRLRMQLARIMVLNMLNLYTFILASFSKISDMSIQLQDIKKNLTNMSTQPSELVLGKQEILTTAFTTVATDNPYSGILNASQMSTASPCYIEKVNCTTYSQPNEATSTSSLSTYTSSLPTSSMSTPESSSTISTLTSLLLLSTVLYNNTLSSENRTNLTSYQSYGNDTDDYSDENILMTGRQMSDEQHQYNEYDYKSGDDNPKRHGVRAADKFSEQKNVPDTQHYILPIFVELFNYNAYKNESDYDFLTPEDYPDENDTHIVDTEDNDLNYSSTALDIYSSTTDTFTTDDGCRYITVCPEASSSLSSMASTSSSSPQSSVSVSTVSFAETTETKTQPPVTTPSSDGEYQVPQDLSLYTKSLDIETRRKLRSLCWETMFGQELVKLTVMDLVLTIVSTLLVDFIRAIFVRTMNNCWCWDLEKKFPQYGDFKIAENILHLVNNQGMVWMGMFFSPGLPLINLIKLIVMMYLRSWTVLTCNVPHEVVFRASSSNNFYLALLLTMLFLCVLPVSYAIVWVEPSWHCGPFSNYEKIYHLFTNSTKKALPSKTIHKALDYIASPGIVIPLLMLLVLIIYYLISLTNALREANNDLKVQLRRERTEERRKVFQMVDRKHRVGGPGDLIESTPFQKWQKTLNVLPNSKSDQTSNNVKEENGQTSNVIKTDARKLLSKLTKHTTHKHMNEESIPIMDADGTDVEQVESLPDDRIMVHHGHKQKLDDMTSVDVHKLELDSAKKRHDEDSTVQHKHARHGKHDKHTKDNGKFETHEKQDKAGKHGKRHGWVDKESKTNKELKKQERKDSSTSVQSDNIPEIRISQSTDDESQEETKFKRQSKSSSADTIITTGTAEQIDTKLEETDNKTVKKSMSKSKAQNEKAGYSGGIKEEHKKHHEIHERDQTNKKPMADIDGKHEKIDDAPIGKSEKKSGRDKHVTEENISKSKQKDHGTKPEDKTKVADRPRECVEELESKTEKGNKSSGKIQHHTITETENKSRSKHASHTHSDGSKIKGKSDTVNELEGNEEDLIIKKKKKRHAETRERSGSITQLVKSEPPVQTELSFKLKSKHKKHTDDGSQLLATESTESGEHVESSKRTEHVRNKHADGKPSLEDDKITAQVHRIDPEVKDTAKQKEKHKTSKDKGKEQPRDGNENLAKDKLFKSDSTKSHTKILSKKSGEEKLPTKSHSEPIKEKKIPSETGFTKHSKIDDESSETSEDDEECNTDDEIKAVKIKTTSKSRQPLPTSSAQIRSTSESDSKTVDEPHSHRIISKTVDNSDHKSSKDSGSDDHISKSRHSDKSYAATSEESHSQKEDNVDEKEEDDDDDDDDDDDEDYTQSQQSQLQSLRSKSTIEEQTSKDSSNNSNDE